MRPRRPFMASSPKKPKPQKRPASKRGGRPSDYTDELALQILDLIAGGESLRSICRRPGMPVRATVANWLFRHKPFRERYDLARQLRADVHFDEILEIADDPTGDVVQNGDKRTVDWENVQRSRLRVDARKWICARMNPQKYGERITTEHTGSIGTSTNMLPSEVAKEFQLTLDRLEREAGFTPNPEVSPEARIQAILDAGNPVPPELYAILQARKKANESPTAQ